LHPVVYQAFQELCQPLDVRGSVLEIGAVAGSESLLHLPALENASSRTGLNQESQGDGILIGNSNSMPQFADGQFNLVLSNATLEHDPYFWKTLAEMKRVLAPGGRLLIGVPGYGEMPRPGLFDRIFRLRSRLASAPTLGVHNYPGD
ncbi:unnamed protein product, partial [Phaeothamnion confervicola]